MQEITTNKSSDRKSLADAKSPSDLLLRIHHRFPGETKEQNRERFIERSLENDDILREVLASWHSLNYRSLMGGKPSRPTTPKSPEDKAKQDEAVQQIAETAKANLTKIVLLDLVQPNGKKLRDCTGAYCAKVGGWLTNIAIATPRTSLVGSVLSEEEVESILKGKFTPPGFRS